MGKYEKRRVFRSYRKAGVPFILAITLARAKARMDPASFVKPEGYKSEAITHCECCGPETLRISTLDGKKAWDFDYWSLAPR